MLKIIKNNSGIRELQRHKYVLYTEVNEKPAYAKIGLRQIFGYIALKIKYRWVIGLRPFYFSFREYYIPLYEENDALNKGGNYYEKQIWD